jgi:rubrerythrin
MGEYLESTAPDGTIRRYVIQSFADALAEARHGAVGDREAVDEATCQRMHGMSRAEWDALAEARHGTCRECGLPWPVADGDPVERCPGCDCPFWVTTHG